MLRLREALTILAMAASGSLLVHPPARADGAEAEKASGAVQNPGAPAAGAPAKLVVTVGKSLIIDSPLNIVRVHVANGDLAEAVAVNPKEVLINGKAPGDTSVIVWQQGGDRLVYDLNVRASNRKLDAARQQIAREFPNDDINLTFENETAFVRGKVKDVTAADRVVAIAASIGATGNIPVNLLRVDVPPVEAQIVLKVRFANVDRQASTALGVNFWNGSFNQQSSLGTGYALYPDDTGHFQVPSSVNLMIFRPDINLLAEIQALETKKVLEILAEPNLMAISGQEAKFLAGGEFPFPVVTPTTNGYVITIQWREYGVRLTFTPVVTPRGTIRLKVAPEVSSLDYNNAVQLQGWTIPGISERKLSTEVELESKQSFVIAGLLDNQVTDQFSKVPGIGSIPVLGKLFQSKIITKQNSELLVLITPEIVRPIQQGQPTPDVKMPIPFISSGSPAAPMQPGIDKTGAVPVNPALNTIPYEEMAQPKKQGQPTTPNFMLVPVQPPPTIPGTNPDGNPTQAPTPTKGR